MGSIFMPAAVKRFLGDERTFWLGCSFAVGAVAVCKGLHLPSRWTSSAAQVDDRFGFIKRGLFGALFTRPLGLEHYRHFAWFAF